MIKKIDNSKIEHQFNAKIYFIQTTITLYKKNKINNKTQFIINSILKNINKNKEKREKQI